MEIPFEGRITQQDYLQAQSLHRLRFPKFVIIIRNIFFGLIAVGLVMSSVSEPAILQTALPVIVILGVLFGARWWLFRSQTVNDWKNNKAFQDSISGTISSQGVHFLGGYFSSDIEWKMYYGFKKSPALLLLYQSPNTFNLFPKEFFSGETDWEAFIRLIEQNIPQKKATVWEKGTNSVLVTLSVILVVVFVIGLVAAFFFGSE